MHIQCMDIIITIHGGQGHGYMDGGATTLIHGIIITVHGIIITIHGILIMATDLLLTTIMGHVVQLAEQSPGHL